MAVEKDNYANSSVKPNKNAEGSLDTATDGVNPHEIAPENAAELREDNAPENEAATARPGESSEAS